MNKKELKDKMLEISSTIGMYELQRASGTYVSINEIFRLKKEFIKYSKIYKKLNGKYELT